MPKQVRKLKDKKAKQSFNALVAEESEATALATRADEQLFEVDTSGTRSRKRRRQEAQSPNPKTTKRKLPTARPRKVHQKKIVTDEDLWAEEAESQARQLPKEAKALKISAGSSYNPTADDHQELLAEALAIELRRKEAHLVQQPEPQSEPEDPELGDDSSDDEPVTKTLTPSITRKLTRSERNKRIRNKIREMKARKKKEARKRLSEIDRAKKIFRELESQEQAKTSQERLLQRAQRRGLSIVDRKVQQKLNQPAAMANAPSISVPLSEELSGSLRSIKAMSQEALKDQQASKRSAIDPQLVVHHLIGKRPKKSRKDSKIKLMPRYRD